MKSARLVACDLCGTAIDLTGHIGRPPHYCSEAHRREADAVRARAYRAQRREEINSLRSTVARIEAALAALTPLTSRSPGHGMSPREPGGAGTPD